MSEEPTILLCMRLTQPLLMPDNELGLCDECGEAVQFRPHAPKHLRRMCWECVEPLALQMADEGTLHMLITPETAEELRAYEKKKHSH